jgi:hypothetical protein
MPKEPDSRRVNGQGSSRRLTDLPPEVLDPIVLDTALVESLATEDPAQAARNLTAHAAVSSTFSDAMTVGPIATFRARLQKLGWMAKELHEISMPKGEVPTGDYDDPNSLSNRILAAAPTLSFQSEARKDRVVKQILEHPIPGNRMDAIAELARRKEPNQPMHFEAFARGQRDAMIDNVTEVCNRYRKGELAAHEIGEHGALAVLNELWDGMNLTQKLRAEPIIAEYPDVALAVAFGSQISASVFERLRLIQIDRPGVDPIDHIDQGIDNLRIRLSNLPHQDVNNFDAMYEVESLGKDISTHYNAARRELINRVRSLGSRGR